MIYKKLEWISFILNLAITIMLLCGVWKHYINHYEFMILIIFCLYTSINDLKYYYRSIER